MQLKSFIDVAPDSHFPIQNLPYGIFSPKVNGDPRVGVAIGDFVLDCGVLEATGCFDSIFVNGQRVFNQSSLNTFMSLGHPAWRAVRAIVQDLVRDDNPTLRDNEDLRARALFLIDSVTLHLPVNIGNYTDFYSSREHATNVGIMFRGAESALMPNWLHMPIGYHGRASSIVVSDTNIKRPSGQKKFPNTDLPVFGPTHELDFELEMGFFIGPGNELGQPVSVNSANEHIFGMVLVNDWSARDIQRWEYQPLGPFLAKNFATSISPWVVTMDALEPFRCAGPAQQPAPLPYLQSRGDFAYDVQLEVSLQSESMSEPTVISRSNFKYLYWNMLQQLAHHTITGCNLRTGDLLASGTISGPTPDSYGSLLELAWKGTKPLALPDDTVRTFLQDGDSLIMTGYAQGDGFRVGFGEVRGTVVG